MDNQYVKYRVRRGTALLLAIAVTMLLFIIGFAFLTNTQTTRQTVKGLDRAATLDAAIDAVVAQIDQVLVEDLANAGPDGTPGNADDAQLLDGTNGNEYYDYPGPDDPWLASLEPEFLGNILGTDYYGWRHITDLYGDNFGTDSLGFSLFDPDDRTDPTQWDIATGGLWWVFNFTGSLSSPHKFTVAKIVDDSDGVETIADGGSWNNPSDIFDWGARADADGDGVADARWVKVPDITGSNGENVYAAVRIIDNCGMINVNTAYTNTENFAPSKDWDGSLLTQINLDTYPQPDVYAGAGLIGIRAISENNPSALDILHSVRSGFPASLPDAQVFHDELAIRIGNPDFTTSNINYQPFDISDELELRNRYFLDSDVASRLGYDDFLGTQYWSKTFTPDRRADGSVVGSVGKELPYDPGGNLDAWFDKATCAAVPSAGTDGWTPATPNIFNYNRRKITTTYSFDRTIIPKLVTTAMPTNALTEWNTWNKWSTTNWSYQPVSIKQFATGVPTGSEIDLLAAAFWLGLPADPKVEDRFGSVSTYDYDRDTLAYQLAVNLIDYQDVDVNPTHHRALINTELVDFFGVEDMADIRENTLLISEVGYFNSSGTDLYAIEIFNPGTTPKNTLADYRIEIVNHTTRVIIGSFDLDGTLASGAVKVYVNDVQANNSATGLPPGGFGTNISGAVPPAMLSGTFEFNTDNEIILFRTSAGFPLPQKMPVDRIEVQVDTTGSDKIETAERDNELIGGSDLLLAGDPSFWDIQTLLYPTGSAVHPTLNVAPSPAGTTYEIQLDINNTALRTIGEVENVIAVGYSYNTVTHECHALTEGVGKSIVKLQDGSNKDAEAGIAGSDIKSYGRINLADPDYWSLMRYLTYFEPFRDKDSGGIGIDNDGNGSANDRFELGIAGRININTAPWFVIAQLPWIQIPTLQNDNADKFKLAHAIVAFRDKIDLSSADRLNNAGAPNYINRLAATGIDPLKISKTPGFTDISQLLQVINIIGIPPNAYDVRKYLSIASDPADYSTDTIADDFEERDVIFQRVSNLATVRSDVFTAYILVRVGEFGPQKRVIAIFDRTNVFGPGDTPKLVALHPVPDPS